MHRVVLVPSCISQIPRQVHINSNPFQGPPNDIKEKVLGQEVEYNKLTHLIEMPWVLIKFLDLEGGCLFEAGCLLNFHHFHKVVSLFCNKTITKKKL